MSDMVEKIQPELNFGKISERSYLSQPGFPAPRRESTNVDMHAFLEKLETGEVYNLSIDNRTINGGAMVSAFYDGQPKRKGGWKVHATIIPELVNQVRTYIETQLELNFQEENK